MRVLIYIFLLYKTWFCISSADHLIGKLNKMVHPGDGLNCLFSYFSRNVYIVLLDQQTILMDEF